MANSSKDILISFVVPVYNCEQWIEKCIKSLLGQSANNYEIIIVDDGSTDNSSKICKELAGNHNNIHYIRQDNQGHSKARLMGLSKAQGTYVGFVDSDDWVNKDYINKCTSVISKYTDVDIIYFNEEFVYEHESIINKHTDPSHKGFFGKNKIHEVIRRSIIMPYRNLYPRISLHLGQCLCKKSLWDDNVYYVPNLLFGEDRTWLIEVLFNSSSIYFLDDVLYYYNRCNEKSLTSINGQAPDLEYYEAVYNRHNGVDADLVNQLFYEFIFNLKMYYLKEKLLTKQKIKDISKDFYKKAEKSYLFFDKIDNCSRCAFQYKFLYWCIKYKCLRAYLLLFRFILFIKRKNKPRS